MNEQQILNRRLDSMLEEPSLSTRRLIEGVLSSLATQRERVDIIEEQMGLMICMEEVNGKLAQKISLDEMMEFLEFINQSLAKKTNHEDVRQILRTHLNSDHNKDIKQVQASVKTLAASILQFQETSCLKFKETEQNLKWHNDYLYSKIQSLREEISSTMGSGSKQTREARVHSEPDGGCYPVSEWVQSVEQLRMYCIKNSKDIANVNHRLNQIPSPIPNLRQTDSSLSVVRQEVCRLQKEMNIIYRNICYENIVARWGCPQSTNKGGKMKWEYQLINTLKDTYAWDKGCTDITIRSPGIYQVVLAEFSKAKAYYKLYLNGVAVEEMESQLNPTKAQVSTSVVTVEAGSRLHVTLDGQCQEGILWIKRL